MPTWKTPRAESSRPRSAAPANAAWPARPQLLSAAQKKLFCPRFIEATRKIKVGPTDREAQPDMGPVITRQHRDRVLELIEAGVKEGAKIPADGRGVKVSEAPNGFYVGATILDDVETGMTVAKRRNFRPGAQRDAHGGFGKRHRTGEQIALRQRRFNFYAERKSRARIQTSRQCGMVGINIGVPASMAWFPFNGWNESFFGDLHMQGSEGVQFFTQQKVTMSRWFSYGEGDIWHTEAKK